ncbi:heterokaryon incompatibility protein-domain-containing protein [Macrophomina phaseolina]|uniref:Heterokaryon incompatibility protein-domain-containing protein n=1 Tax=Macrophomina phaseolina TaxID=35725 RepID=A0ABQ8GR21_9PEZI|nr:heterokaryon incompatibility protein-domain-containing protein [Macrophomina phaseolina]
MDQREVRLFVLKPGCASDPIMGRIFHCILDSGQHIPYEAVSYTWADAYGDSSYSETAYCNHAAVRITRNCSSALRRIRHGMDSKVIWIDQICIDQTNMAERGHQVALMPRIYASATQVLIYLCSVEDARYFAGPMPNPNSENTIGFPSVSHLLDADVLRHPWFRRVWVLQEVANARKATLLSSDSSADWETFRNSNSTLRAIPSILSLNLREFVPLSGFADLLERARECYASDPRDKVFALLGILMLPDSAPLVPNYAKSVETVFTETAVALIKSTRNLSILSSCWPEESSLIMPSWVPDWSTKSERTSLRQEFANPPWNARRMDRLPSRFVGMTVGDSICCQNGKLFIRGRHLDTISGEFIPSHINDGEAQRIQTLWLLSPRWKGFKYSTRNSWCVTVLKAAIEDEIWQLDGGDILFVLRKQQKSYKLIGECFLYGISHHVHKEYSAPPGPGICQDCSPFAEVIRSASVEVSLC